MDDKKTQSKDLPIQKHNPLMGSGKWRKRNVLTFFAFLFAAVVVSTILTGGYYFLGGENSRSETAMKVVRIGTQMTMPNVYINGTGVSSQFFFSADVKAHMQKVLGNEDKAVGELHGKMSFSSLWTTVDWVDGQYLSKLYFLHPHDLDRQPNYQETYAQTWEALDILPEGTVSELALSFDDLYSIDEVQSFLREFDIHIPWYAVHTGTEDEKGMYLTDKRIFGLFDHPTFDVSKNSSFRSSGETIGNEFKAGLQFLVENDRLAKKFLWSLDGTVNFDEMYQYVEDNGVRTYGVVVTGPTKELLKIMENEQILYASLGEVTYWNWYNRPAYGVMY
ncbi:anti-sigma factor [Alkalihalobacterium elongatum]|uniref:anti-sigma factor n=1 Tax=Alkalihalobacterium elongatum TaxID=2675466 RepID=UPI001C1FF5CA|nr:anti-sigma factor [Alkalihalobacterium elongatum]